MTRSRPPCARRHSRGLTLIELMVSITIGLVIVIAVLAGYMGSASAGKMTQAQVRMDEDAQAALAIVAQHLRMAGNNPIQGNRLEDTRRNPIYGPAAFTEFAVRGCEDNFSNISDSKIGRPDDLTCAGSATRRHSISVTYEADAFNTVPTSAKVKEPTDCLGSSLPTRPEVVTVIKGAKTETFTVSVAVAENRFYIAETKEVVPSLRCKGNGSATPEPLVENVENLWFEFGMRPAGSDDTEGIAGYLRPSQFETVDSLKSLSEVQRWRLVKAVRLCVVVRSQEPVVSDIASARYRLCDGTMETNPPDLHLRRAYSKTVVLRNRE